MADSCRAWVLRGILAALLLALPQASARAAPAVKSEHGSWKVVCETPVGQGEQCVMVQNVADTTRPQLGLVIIVLKTPEKTMLRVVAPVGVLLTEGVVIKIDEKDLGRVGFARCVCPDGCIAEFGLTPELIGQLGTGNAATLAIYETPGKSIGFPVNLAGFKDGLATLP